MCLTYVKSRNRQTTAQSSTLEVGYFCLHARTAVSTSARAAEERARAVVDESHYPMYKENSLSKIYEKLFLIFLDESHYPMYKENSLSKIYEKLFLIFLAPRPVIELEHPAFPVPSYIYFSSHYTVVDLSNAKVFSWCIFPPNVKGHIMHYLRENNTRCPVAACPAKLKSNKVKDDALLAADIDELRKTQNQNVTADVMDITEFEE
ncbi:hypothetical protein ACFX13_010952 [Malus domestica]